MEIVMENINVPFLMMAALYFWPTLAALFNKGASPSDRLAAFAGNLFLGWTVIGWFFVYCFATANHKGRARVRQAQADFYLREDAKFRASNSAE
jgi:Superinfection immunity protein